MNAKLFASPFRALQRGLVLASVLVALFAARNASAVTLSSSFTLPFGMPLQTEDEPTIGSFNFASSPGWTGGTVTSLGPVSITLSFYGLDTNNLPSPGFDYNNITLALGGVNTGILLNGYGNGLDTRTFNTTLANEAAIINVMNNTGGVLTVGLFDARRPDNAPLDPDITWQENPFLLLGGTATLSFPDAVAVPFTPVQTLGYGLIALVVAWRRFRWVNPFALVMARVAAR